MCEECANDEVCGCGGNNVGMDENLSVNISENQGFMSLQPGGSWTFSYPMNHPDDEVIGNIFSYQFKGAALQWWDWGDLEAHANREVKLQSWLSGGRYEPPSNPLDLVVPASSNKMRFTVVGREMRSM